MTRHLAYQAHDRFPASFGDQREWAVEQAIRLASDFDEPGMIAVAAVTCGWTPEQLATRVEHLCDLADEVADAETNGPTGRWHAAVDEYRAALTAIASGPLIESLDDGQRLVAEPVVREPSALRVVRGGA
jgi:hypothetical protein